MSAIDIAFRVATAVTILTECDHVGPVRLHPEVLWCAGCGAIKQGDKQWTYPARVHEVLRTAEAVDREELVGQLEASIDHAQWRKKMVAKGLLAPRAQRRIGE